MKEPVPNYDGIKGTFDSEKMTIEEKKEELWKEFEMCPTIGEAIASNHNNTAFDLDDDYFPYQVQFRERGADPHQSEPLLRELFVSMEHLIEEEYGADRIKEKKMGMYKGTVKKW